MPWLQHYTPFVSDLSLTKSVNDATPDLNDLIVYTITVSNAGPDNATGVAVEDQLPSSLTYVSDNGSGAYNSSTGIWTIGALNNGSNTSLQITARVTGTGTTTNTAQVSASDYDDPDSTPGNDAPGEDDQDDAGISTPAVVDLELDKSVNDASPDYGDHIIFTITVTNRSAYDNATGVQVKDILPTGLTYVSDNSSGNYNSTTGVWTVGTVNKNNGTRSIQITAQVDDTGSFDNFAQVSACTENDVDSTPNNGDASEDDDDHQTVTVASAADLRLSKSVNDATPDLNDNITFTITVLISRSKPGRR